MVAYNTMLLLVIVGGILAGFFMLPFFIYILYPSMPLSIQGVTGRIIWTIGSLASGPNVLDLTKDGRYQMRVCESAPDDWTDADGEHQEWRFKRDGEWVGIDGPDKHWSRLGKSRFGIVYDKDEQTYGRLADFDLAADGGAPLIQRADHDAFRISDVREVAEEEIVLRIEKIIARFREAGGINQIQLARQVAQKEYGGEGRMSELLMAIVILTALFMGTVSGLFITGSL